MSEQLCNGGCGNEATYKGWCKIKWKAGNKFATGCPIIENKRGKSISAARIEESKQGENPMQNPEICKKNHSEERNKKCSNTLKKMGKLGLLPQQIECKELKEKRRKNICISIKRLLENRNHPIQLETLEKRKKRLNKMANTLILLGKQKKLPVQNMTEEQKKIFGEKISRKLREGIKSGRIKLSKSWKKVPYKNLSLRSNWESEVAKFLDINGFFWEYETRRIPYWDSDRKLEATTIPDFYIPSINTIIEVKSNADFKSQKTEDKINGIKKQGFKTLLVGRREIKLIKENPDKFLKNILEVEQ